MEHIDTLEALIGDVDTDIRTNMRLTSDLKEGDEGYHSKFQYQVLHDIKRCFLDYVLTYLKDSKLKLMDQKEFQGFHVKEETADTLHSLLRKKNIFINARKVSEPGEGKQVKKDNKQKRENRDKSVGKSALASALRNIKCNLAGLHDSNVEVVCSITNEVLQGKVFLHSMTMEFETYTPFEQILIWKIGIDSKQVDIIVDSEAVLAIVKLSKFDHRDKFHAPIAEVAPNRSGLKRASEGRKTLVLLKKRRVTGKPSATNNK